MAAKSSLKLWPWQRSFQKRIVFSYGAIFAAVLMVLMIWVGRVVYVAQRDEVTHNLERQAFLAADALEDPLSGFGIEFEREGRKHHEREEHEHQEREPDAEVPKMGGAGAAMSRLQNVALQYASNTGARVTILDAQGYAIADSRQAPGGLSRRLDPNEIAELPKAGSASIVRVDPATGAPALYVTAPVISGPMLFGFVQFAVPLKSLTRNIWVLVLTLGGFGVLALVASALSGAWIGSRLGRPIKALERASLAMAAGDLSQRVVVETNDEIGALAKAFNTMADEVQRTLEQQKAFVANASHELRTPLTNIKLRSEALLNGSEDPEVRRRFLREIDQESDRLARLANTLLDLARLDQARERKSSRTSDPLEALSAVVNLMRGRAEDSGIHLETDLQRDLPHVHIETEALETILINLLDNAFKYTPANGAVTLHAHASGEWLRIEVRDTGAGIPEADLPHVFERFYRVDKARSRRGERSGSGVGLGLAIVKELVDRCDGRITIASEEGKGTIVTLQLRVTNS